MNERLPLTRRHVLAGATATAAALVLPMPTHVRAAIPDHRIVPRAEWGFDGWESTPAALEPGGLTHFVVHYHGAAGAGGTGVGVPQQIHQLHKERPDGTVGIAYSFVVTQAGEIFEGRGFDYRQAATYGANRTSLAVQVHVHGDMAPTAEALAALEWIYRHTHEHLGAQLPGALRVSGHEDHTTTDCPGAPLRAWVDGRGQELYAEQAGQPPAPSTPSYPGPDAFRIGQAHPAVVDLDHALIRKGFTDHHDGDGYQPGEIFTEYTRLNVADFQTAQGWSGSDADGYPGPVTWERLMA